MTNKPKRILIVEDEILIADTLGLNLQRNGYQLTGVAITYEEATAAVRNEMPDCVLLDIRLRGHKTGIDVARYLRELSRPPPFVFLTSQMDDRYLELAKQTHPAGYLGKPIHINSLLATLKMVLFNADSYREQGRTLQLRYQGVNHVVNINKIEYLQSEHVYVRVVLGGEKSVLQRASLKEVTELIGSDRFVQTHRGYVINLDRVTGYDTKGVFFGSVHIPVSRSHRQEIMDKLS